MNRFLAPLRVRGVRRASIGILACVLGAGGSVAMAGEPETGGGVLGGGSRPAGPCGDDFNNSGRVSPQDLYDFISAWYAQVAAADFNGSGVVDVQDIYDYVEVLLNGCP